MKSNQQNLINFLELAILLVLPLPFLHLNVWYVILGISITLLSKYLRKEPWSDYGFKKTEGSKLLLAIFIGVVFGVLDSYYIEPLISRLTGKSPDLSSLNEIKGSLKYLLVYWVLAWLVGGLFEEYFFRGYLMHRFKSIIKNPVLYRWVAVFVISVVFGFGHDYQDMPGIFGAFYFSLIMCALYFYFKENVWYLVCIHAIYDMIGLYKLYAGQ